MIVKYYTIYKVTNTVNNKVYIGAHSTYNLDDGYVGSGKLLKKAVKKYGEGSFKREILFFCNSEEEMYVAERKLVDKQFVESKRTYNLKMGGEGGCGLGETHPNYHRVVSRSTRNKMRIKAIGRHHSEETKQMLREMNTGENNPRYGVPVTRKTRGKMSIAQTGKKMPDGFAESVSQRFEGVPLSEEHRQKLSEAWFRDTEKYEIRCDKISKALTGKKLSPERCAQISERMKGEKHSMYGKKHSKEALEKMSRCKSVENLTPDQRKVISLAATCRNNKKRLREFFEYFYYLMVEPSHV